MKSSAKTPAEYVASLPAGRREAIVAVRALVNKHLPKGYRESMGYGMINWVVPLEVYPDTYNGQPLMLAALSSQKQYMAVYLMTVYGHAGTEREFRDAFAKAGKKLDMGKACVRFRSLEDLVLPAVGKAIACCPMAHYVALAKAARGERLERPARSGPAKKRAAARPAPAKARAAGALKKAAKKRATR